MRTSTITQDDAVADTVPGTVSGVADAPPSASPDPGEHRDPGAERGATGGRRSRSGPIKGGAVLLAVSAGTAAVSAALPAAGGELTTDARTVLSVFTAALLCWTLTRADDAFIGMAAVAVLVATGILPYGDVLGLLGSETVWLLVAAGVMAAGIEASGLPARAARALIVRAGSVRALFHLVTAGVVLTALAIPSTSGRAALALPVFLALARVFAERPAVVRALALALPTTILLSAIASLIGAAAHLIGDEILRGMTGSGIGFGQWLLLGVPLAVVSAHLAAELVLLLMTRRADRRGRLALDAEQLADPAHEEAASGGDAPRRLTSAQWRMLALVAVVVALWCTESLHGVPPTAVALLGALAATAPGFGTTPMTAALKSVPWPLLVFMISAAALADALVRTGAAEWVAQAALAGTAGMNATAVLAAVVAVSAASHLVLQSRSARAAVLVPAVIPLASAVGLDPAAAVFAFTAAAGFCHTLTSSAKPVALFSDLPDGTPTYGRADLLRLSALLGPLMVALVLGAALFLWPHLGLPLR
ncbi:SLC13 family permease [Nocardiopsis salina]|uniref:SLC13 family permease n=1 Tax=Nocardiopsis salina TaxID=245836 RepID=UPI000347EC9A|nr:SLC13 family permease [Nocardiopsis salina]